MNIGLDVYVICRLVLAEKMLANPSDEKYRRAFDALRQALLTENERENEAELPMLLRRQAGGT